MSICSKCKIDKDDTEYYYSKVTTKKKGTYEKKASWCKKCTKDGALKHIRENLDERKLWAVDYKGGKCSVCGYGKCLAALDFHHIDPIIKEFDFSNNWFKSKEILQAELDKCILVCCRCHREIHFMSERDKYR